MAQRGRQTTSPSEGRPDNGERKTPWAEQSENALLAALSEDERLAASARGKLVALSTRQGLYSPDVAIEAAYFPVDCVISVVTHMIDGTVVEIGTIGREGTTAIPLLMGATSTANESFCQVPGRAWKMPVADFTRLVESSERFRAATTRFLHGYVNVLGQLAACNRVHTVYERCCRWLLMTQDRVGADQFPLTHEFLAQMLGSQRSSVTLAAAALQRAGFITYERGCITILDRERLKETACECYEIARDQFTASFGLG